MELNALTHQEVIAVHADPDSMEKTVAKVTFFLTTYHLSLCFFSTLFYLQHCENSPSLYVIFNQLSVIHVPHLTSDHRLS